MTTTTKFLWVLLLVSVAVAGIALSMWGIPAPTAEIRKSIPIDGLGK